MKTFIALIFCAIFLVACKKEDGDTFLSSLRGKYETSTILRVKAPVMYVYNNKITDTSIINSFVRRQRNSPSLIYTSTETINYIPLRVNFDYPDSALVTNSFNNSFRTKKQIIDGSVLKLEYRDSIYYTIRISPTSLPRFRCDSLGAFTQKYKTETITKSFYSPSETILFHSALPFYTLLMENNEIIYPIASLYVRSGIDGNPLNYCFRYQSFISGIFATDIERKIGLYDTILLQEKLAVLNKVQ